MAQKKKLYKFQTELKRTEECLRYNQTLSETLPKETLDLFEGGNYRFYTNYPIQFQNGYYMSIQCSFGHYCSPKESIEDPAQYDSYEIMVGYVGAKMIDLNDTFPDIGFNSGMCVYVSAKKVQQIYDHIAALQTPEARKPRINNLLKEL
jgi:hypothetical protein